MRAAAAVPSPADANRALRFQRVCLVIGFWLAGAGVYALRRLLLLWLRSQIEATGQWIELSEPARLWLLLIPIAFCCGALAMQSCWLPRWGRLASRTAAMIVVPPLLLITWIIAEIGPHRLDAVAANGHQYVLATGGYGFDDQLMLYEVGDIAGLSWRVVSDLFDDPEHDAPTGDEHLVVSPDGRWLLASRGGRWLDCFRLAGGEASRVDLNVDLPGNNHRTEFDLRMRSARIAALTSLRP